MVGETNEELITKNFPELKRDVKTSHWKDAQSARGREERWTDTRCF